MHETTIKQLKKGEFFTLRNYGDNPPEARVYVRGDYEKSEKKYSCSRFSDFCAESFFKGSRTVYAGFTF